VFRTITTAANLRLWVARNPPMHVSGHMCEEERGLCSWITHSGTLRRSVVSGHTVQVIHVFTWSSERDLHKVAPRYINSVFEGRIGCEDDVDCDLC
jgi:hypothetical protein